MKYCPECGSVIEEKEMCECGYVVATGKVDEKVREKLVSSHPSPSIIPDVPGIPMMVDEIPNNLPPVYFVKGKSDDIVKEAIYDSIRYCFGKGLSQKGIEDLLVQLYQNNVMSKEDFILTLQSLLALRIDNQLKNAIERIKNEKED